MEVTFTPQICVGDDAEFTGTITYKTPNYLQRMEYAEMYKSLDGIGIMKAIYPIVVDSVVKFDLKSKENPDLVINDIETAGYYTETSKAIQELSLKFIEGCNLGKPKLKV